MGWIIKAQIFLKARSRREPKPVALRSIGTAVLGFAIPPITGKWRD
jgi:hypothetical protein